MSTRLAISKIEEAIACTTPQEFLAALAFVLESRRVFFGNVFLGEVRKIIDNAIHFNGQAMVIPLFGCTK